MTLAGHPDHLLSHATPNPAALRTTLVAGLLCIGMLSGIAPAFATPSAMRHHLWVAGAFLAPPAGPGSGRLVAWRSGTALTKAVRFAPPKTLQGNSFFVAYDALRHSIYVPTLAGRTYIVGSRTFTPEGSFASIKGARVAAVSPDHRELLVLSPRQTAAYSIAGHERLYVLPFGGNAIAFDAGTNRAFIGGNPNNRITEIDVASGKTLRQLPVGHSGDMIWANGKLFSADMKTGVMTVFDPATNRITRIRTPEVDAHFTYQHIPQATAGFMQLAADPAHHRVYATGFSGHILVFSSRTRPRYLKEVAVRANPHVDKLSGLAVIDHGRDALVTVENLKTTVVVRLSDGAIQRTLTGIASNRWVRLAAD